MSNDLHSLKSWKIVSSEYPLTTPWLRVRQDTCALPNGSVINDYYVVERADVVGIVAVTPQNEVVFNTQYKHGIQEFMHEVPAGMIDPGETPLQAAQRELEEETGYTATEWVPITTMVASPTSETNRYTVFLARNATPNGKKVNFPKEEIYNDLVPIRELDTRMQSGDVTSLWSIAAIDRAIAYLRNHSLL